MTPRARLPWYAPLLLRPRRIQENLDRVRAAGIVREVPNLWQVYLGILLMAHRLLHRPDTVGTSRARPVRRTRRARLLANRVVRFPFLVMERAIAPLDFSGLGSSPERVIRHLLGAHHDDKQFLYDLELLACHPGKLEELCEATLAVLEGDTPRALWLRDLTVFERYHEELLAAARAALEGPIQMSPADAEHPYVSLRGYLSWCARQPVSPRETWRALRRGELSFSPEGAAGARRAV